MNSNYLRAFALAGALAALTATVGCAKKAKEAPPTPAQPPAQTSPTPVPPTPAPAPTPPAPSEPGAAELVSQMQPVFFDFDSYSLNDAARAALDGNARLLRDHPALNVTIEGHCDERGTVEYNQALGERRALAARDYLASAGIASSRMRVISYGKERPFATGTDEASYALNRRAHFSTS